MRTSLEHLPPIKQRELERIVAALFEEFGETISTASGEWKKQGRILKIVLFGSYARGGWVDEPHTAKGYQSDYDLLIIVNHKKLTDRVATWAKAEERFYRELAITKTLRTPVNFIVHTLQEVNDALAHGRYFFMDIARDGIALYESDDTELHQPKPKTPERAYALAREYFDEWFPAAMKRFEGAQFYREKGYLKDAAFDFHQATERLYNCVLLVLTFYSPHVHNIGFLRSQAERLDNRLIWAWPRDTHAESARFEKLKEAYVKARFSVHYKVNAEELDWYSRCIEELGRTVQAICLERIAALEAEITNAAE